MTPAEQLLWTKLRSKQCHLFKFRRQHAIGSFIVNFFCPEQLLVVETDGDVHAEQMKITKDRQRERHLRSLGLQVVCYANYEVLNNLNGVLEHLLECYPRTLPPLTPPYKGGELDKTPT